MKIENTGSCKSSVLITSGFQIRKLEYPKLKLQKRTETTEMGILVIADHNQRQF